MNLFGIFAKFWQPGRVKTRLAARIGHQAASRVYRAFIEVLIDRLGDCGDRRVLAYWPEDCRDDFFAIAGQNWVLERQSDGDLGQRMASYFQTAFKSGAGRVVLIGSDSPTIPTAYIERAFALLEHQRVVLGPTRDGGYYLVGAADYVPPIFEDISWSSSAVWQQTVSHLSRCRIGFAQLPEWYDVDDSSDLIHLRDHLCQLVEDMPYYRTLWQVVRSVSL